MLHHGFWNFVVLSGILAKSFSLDKTDLITTNTDCTISEDPLPLTKVDKYHPPLNIVINSPKLKTKKGSNIKDIVVRYNFRKGDYEKLYQLLREADWTSLYNETDINLTVKKFYKFIFQIFDECIPKQKVKGKSSKYPVWYTKEIKDKLKYKQKLFTKLKETLLDYNLRHEFRNLRKDIKTKIKLAHTQYIEGIQQDISYKPNVKYSNDEEIVNLFAKYFKSNYDSLNSSVNSNPVSDYAQLGSLNIKDITENEVENAIKKINVRAAAGTDGIPGYIIVGCVELLL
ncbi:hypothetical protein ILUMI_12637 [Ignelater luminosus]|uniref:Uncharacterized protein n=1 Tax=Ignelater luminosus TaxID=2038154 RepID=A0A8K0CXR4_IGNLU|nr:hypothetical protein ILUMI_12637 [Ignelater luminosus]